MQGRDIPGLTDSGSKDDSSPRSLRICVKMCIVESEDPYTTECQIVWLGNSYQKEGIGNRLQKHPCHRYHPGPIKGRHSVGVEVGTAQKAQLLLKWSNNSQSNSLCFFRRNTPQLSKWWRERVRESITRYMESLEEMCTRVWSVSSWDMPK